MEMRVTRFGKFAAVLLLHGMTGCGRLIGRIAPDSIRESKTYFEELRQRQIDQILQSFDSSADKDRLRVDLGKVIALVPQQEPESVETLGATVECKASGLCTKLIILEYKYPDHWIMFQVTTSNRSGHDAITDLTVTPESVPLESMSQFTLRAKGWLNYTILLMALLSVGFATYALVLCIRTPIQRWKWLWLIVTILGLGKLGIEWSSGELWYKIFHLSILPAGWGFDSESPFMYASIPAGAILFLLMRSRLRRRSSPALPFGTTASASAANQAESDPSQ